jgi:dTDP-4-dehydrorhamnose 3,5-epimerase
VTRVGEREGDVTGDVGIDLLRAISDAAIRDRPTVDASSKELASGIAGVEIRRLTIHADPRGALTPVADIRDDFWSDPIVYAYRFSILPGRIKGWGMHELQTDRYFVVSGDVRVVLFDGREESDSAGAMVQIHFTDRTPGLVKIPPGVWHADQNWGQTEAHVLNFPTRPYDPEHPDKYRIDPHNGTIPFDWSVRDG